MDESFKDFFDNLPTGVTYSLLASLIFYWCGALITKIKPRVQSIFTNTLIRKNVALVIISIIGLILSITFFVKIIYDINSFTIDRLFLGIYIIMAFDVFISSAARLFYLIKSGSQKK